VAGYAFLHQLRHLLEGVLAVSQAGGVQRDLVEFTVDGKAQLLEFQRQLADQRGANFQRDVFDLPHPGATGGLGGAFLTLEGVGSFERGMTNGRGFLALAIMIFGKWTPLGSWGAALLSASPTPCRPNRTPGVNLPPQFIGSLPYILTILVLAGFAGRRAPGGEGIPYEKEG
jgi:simple sugar transport system permease protein